MEIMRAYSAGALNLINELARRTHMRASRYAFNFLEMAFDNAAEIIALHPDNDPGRPLGVGVSKVTIVPNKPS
jgi:hypothetical protein